MLPKCLKYGVVLACGVLLLAGLPASADDKKGDKLAPAGAWGKKDGELTLAFADKGVLKIAPHGDRAGVLDQTFSHRFTADREQRFTGIVARRFSPR